MTQAREKRWRIADSATIVSDTERIAEVHRRSFARFPRPGNYHPARGRSRTLHELIAKSATELARLIRAREVSSAEVVDAHLRRIEDVNPTLHAVVQLCADAARKQALAADAALARGDAPGPLHGVPFTVKDWIETEGVVCAAGFAERCDYVPKHDATVVERMRARGAIMLGKTKPGDRADVYAEPHNPYDLTRTPGASSSGEAAIIAACGSPLGLGSDSGGSLRWPAHCCGIAALKPTNGLVPSTGHFPRIGALSDPRTTIGPMARSVEDLGLAGVIPMPLGNAASVDLARLRVAFYTRMAGAAPTAETVLTTEIAATALSNAGCTVSEARPPRIEEALEITRAYWARPESISLSRWMPSGASTLSGDDIERSLFEWDRLRRTFISFMDDYDLIVCPVAADEAPPLGETTEETYLYTLPYSLTGWPVAVVRAGSTAGGLPIGVQVVARPWHDHVALAAAQCVETSLGGWRPPAI